MKPIFLTQEQKDKLLKMCKALFPDYCYSCEEYKSFWIDKEGFVFLVKKENPETEHSKTIDKIKIHWFEFCMTYLGEELGVYSYKNTFISTHPVDYLYTHFKN